jgi:hypothetical protein
MSFIWAKKMMLTVLTGWVEVGHYLEFCPTIIKIKLKIVPISIADKNGRGGS